jgi:hypothetical protein
MTTLDWLKTLRMMPPTPGMVSSGLAEPLALRLDEEWWTVVTDGRALLALHGRVDGVQEGQESAVTAVTRHLAANPTGRAVSWLDLKTWIGPVSPPVPCERCEGRGIEPTVADEPCGSCDGDGTQNPVQQGLFLGAPIDRQILARFTERLDPDSDPLRQAGDLAGRDSVVAGLLNGLAETAQLDAEHLGLRQVLADRLEELGHLQLAAVFRRPPTVLIALLGKNVCWLEAPEWRVILAARNPPPGTDFSGEDRFPLE